ncbi:hypothetical protein RJD24_06075 [Bacillaceae bacterium IKA-2]|nr:hypothetical protein RJD24_06075 [Bacillaceae bacterium IKA-2]
MSRKMLFFIIGFFSFMLSAKIFPAFEVLQYEVILSSLVFSPFSWLGSIFLFIVGFLAVSRVIKTSIERVMITASLRKELNWLLGIVVLFVILALESFWVALLGLGISLFYGIMDANVQKRSRYYGS